MGSTDLPPQISQKKMVMSILIAVCLAENQLSFVTILTNPDV